MPDSVRPAVDAAELAQRLGGNRDVIRKLAAVFEQSFPTWLSDLDAAVRTGDGERLRKAAHTAKGALATLAAMPAADLARLLEDMGKAGEFANAPAGIAALTAELDRVREAFRSIVAENAKPDLPGKG